MSGISHHGWVPHQGLHSSSDPASPSPSRENLERIAIVPSSRVEFRPLSLLNHLVAEMAKAPTSDEVLQAACRSLVEDFGYYNVTILVYASSTKSLHIQANAGAYTHILTRTPISFPETTGLVGKAARTQSAWLARDTQWVEEFFQLPGMDIRSEAVFPLIAGQALLGVFSVDSNQVDAFRESDLDLLSLVSERMAVELERSRLIERLREELKEKENVEAQAKISLSLLNAAFNSTADGLLMVDPHGKVTGFNQEFVKLWRIPQALAERRDDNAMLAFVLDQLMDPDAFVSRIRTLYANPEMVACEVLELKEGRVLERYSIPQRLDGKIVGRVWSFRDLTERRRAAETQARLQNQLLNGQKMEALGRLAGGIAHDFNNLLAGIMGTAEVLRASGLDDTEQVERLNDIGQACCRAKELIRGILNFSGQRGVHQEPTQPARIVKEAAQLLKASSPVPISIQISAAAANAWILVDVGQLHQALMNLGSNAAYAMRGRQGSIQLMVDFASEFSTDRGMPEMGSRPHLQIAVVDEGPGIPESVMARIFEPFFTTKPVGEGTGMGLAIVHGIVQSNGGLLQVDSAPGKGTRMNLCFPLIEPQTSGPAASTAGEPQWTGRRILVVDDETLITRMAAKMFKQLGFEVTTLNCPVKALEVLTARSSSWDLLLTDLTMPEMSGSKLAEKAHALDPSMPIILMSGYLPDQASDHLKAVGVTTVLEKPFDLTILTQTLLTVMPARHRSI